MSDLPIDPSGTAPPLPAGLFDEQRPLTKSEAARTLTPAKLDEGNPSGTHPQPELPFAEDILNAAAAQHAAQQQLPFAEDLLGTGPAANFSGPMSGLGWDEYARQAPLGRVLNAFGQGAAQGWGTGNLGFSPETEDALKKYGIFNDVTKGQNSIIRAFNEGVMRPAAAVVDALARGGTALFAGGQAAAAETGREIGQIPDFGTGFGNIPLLARDIAAAPEAFFGSPGELALGIPRAPTVPEINAFHVGESDGVYFGTSAPTAETPGATADMIKHQREAAANANEVGAVPSVYAPGALGPSPEPDFSITNPIGPRTETLAPPVDVNEAARRIAPEAVSDYENLSTQRDALRANIDQAQTTLRENAAAQAPHAAEIADLERRLPDATPRLAKKYEARLAEIVPQHDEWLAGDQYAMLTRDTDEISRMRDEMERLDYRRRDLAPDVNAAYRKAEERFPEPEAPQAAAPAEVPLVGVPAAPGVQPTVEAPVAPETAMLPSGAAQPEAAAVTEQPAAFTTARGSTYEVHDDGTTTRNKSYHTEHGPEDVGLKARSERTIYVDTDRATDLSAAGLHGLGPQGARLVLKDGKASLLTWNGAADRWGVAPSGRDIPFIEVPEVGKSPVEGWRKTDDVPGYEAYSNQHAGNAITEITPRAVAAKAPIPSEVTAEAAPEAPRVVPNIATDVSRKLVAAGRPQDEADASGAFVQAYYNTRAERFEGAKGTGAELYAAEGPEIRAGRGVVAAARREAALERELAQKGREYNQVTIPDESIGVDQRDVDQRSGPAGGADVGGGVEGIREEGDDATTYYQKARDQRKVTRGRVNIVEGARAVITLLKNANASTFIHEVGHVWLEDLLNDALDERAPQQLRDDAATVRNWLGAAPDAALTTAQHERFARGFERYWMLGVAPSRALDRVFAQFRSWLSKIYQTAEELRAPITDDIRDVFDRMLSIKPERATIAPEPEFEAAKGRETPAEGGVDLKAGVSISSDVAALAEGDAEQTAPRDAEAAADQIRDERDNTEARFGNASGGTATEAPGGAAGRPPSPGAVPAAEPGSGAGRGVPEPETISAGGNEASPEGPTTPRSARGAEPTFSAQPYPGPEPTYLDKAGNIRLELLTDDVAARQALREIAEQNGYFMDARRGVVSDAQVLELADSINATAQDLNIAKLRQMSVEDDVPMAARIKAGRQMLLQTEAAVRTAAASGNAEAFIKASYQLNMVQETVSGITAEWGRAGRAFRDMREETEGARDVAAIVREASGRELFQIEGMMKKVNRLGTPAQVAKFTRDAAVSGLFDWVQATFINALLSGPFTHAGYTVAGELYGIFRAGVEGGLAGAIGETRHALGLGKPDYAHMAEMPHELYGLARGSVNGAKAAWDAFKANEPRLPPEAMSGAKPISMGGIIPNPEVGGVKVPIGTVLEGPSRLVTALHTYNWTTFYSASISQQAAHIAMEEARVGRPFQDANLSDMFGIEMVEGAETGTPRQALANRIAYLETNPTPKMIERASEDASQGALMQRPKSGGPTDLISRFMNLGAKVPDISLPGGASIPMGTLRPLKFIDPFVVISSNVLRASLGRGTPLALFKQDVRDDLMMRNGGAAFDRTASKILAGTGFMVAAGSLAARGLLNPSGPSDPRQAAEWRRINGMPHGLRIGNLTFDTLRMGVLGMQMSIAADMWHAISSMSIEDATKVASELVHAFSQNILDESFMRGPSEALRAVENSDRYGAQWVRNFVSSAVPYSVGMSQIAREIDPDTRQARTTMDAIKAKIPFVSESLYPRYDVWGHEVANRGWAGTYHSPVIGDATDAKLYSLHFYPAQAKREIMGVPLTDAQYAEYAMTRGRLAKQMVDSLLGTPGFSMQPELAQTTGVRDVMEAATRIAEQKVRMHSLGTAHDITRQAIENKRLQLKAPPTVH